MAAVGVDGVVVRLSLPVERQDLAGTVAGLQSGRTRDDVHRLEVPDGEPILTVGRARVARRVAVHGRLGPEEDVAGIAELLLVEGRVARLREVKTGGVAERDVVNIGAAPDVGLTVGHRVGRARGARPHRVSRGVAGGDHAVGDDPAAQDHGRAEFGIRRDEGATGVGIAEVATDVDAQLGEDLGVLVQGHVVTDAQLDAARLGEDRPDRDDTRVVGVVARHRRVVLGEVGRAVADQVEVLVEGGALTHGEPNVAGDGVSQDESEIGVGLGEIDTGASLQRNIIRSRREAQVRGAVDVVGAVRVGAGEGGAAQGVDVEVLGEGPDRTALGVDDDGLAEHIGSRVGVGVDDRARPRAQRHVAGCQVRVAGRLDHADAQVSGHLVEMDPERLVVVGSEVMGVELAERTADGVDLDLEEVVRQADPADTRDAARLAKSVVASGHRDVAPGDVDSGPGGAAAVEVVGVDAGRVVVGVENAVVELRVEDAGRRTKDHIGEEGPRPGRARLGLGAGAQSGRVDVPDPQVTPTTLLDHGDGAVGQDVDLAAAFGQTLAGAGLVVGPGRVDVGAGDHVDLGRRGGVEDRDVVPSPDVLEGHGGPQGREVGREGDGDDGTTDDDGCVDPAGAGGAVGPEVAGGGNRLHRRTAAVGRGQTVRGVAVHFDVADSGRVDPLRAVTQGDHRVVACLDGLDNGCVCRRARRERAGPHCLEVEVGVDSRLSIEVDRLEGRCHADLAGVEDLVEDQGDRVRNGADRAELRVEGDAVAVEGLSARIRVTKDGATLIGDPQGSDVVDDVAINRDVVPGRARCPQALDHDIRCREEVLDVPAPDGAVGTGWGRVGTVVDGDADDGGRGDVHVGVEGPDGHALRGRRALDADRLVGPVADQEGVPRLLHVEQAVDTVDESAAVRVTRVAGVVRVEDRGWELVIDDRVDPDRPAGHGVADAQGGPELARANGDVARLGDDRAGGVDDEDRVRFTEQVDGRLPEDLSLGLVADVGAGRADVEEATGAVCVHVEALEAGQREDGEFGGADHGFVDSIDHGVAEELHLGVGIGVTTPTTTAGAGVGPEAEVGVLGPDPDLISLEVGRREQVHHDVVVDIDVGTGVGVGPERVSTRVRSGQSTNPLVAADEVAVRRVDDPAHARTGGHLQQRTEHFGVARDRRGDRGCVFTSDADPLRGVVIRIGVGAQAARAGRGPSHAVERGCRVDEDRAVGPDGARNLREDGVADLGVGVGVSPCDEASRAVDRLGGRRSAGKGRDGHVAVGEDVRRRAHLDTHVVDGVHEGVRGSEAQEAATLADRRGRGLEIALTVDDDRVPPQCAALDLGRQRDGHGGLRVDVAEVEQSATDAGRGCFDDPVGRGRTG